MSVRVSAPSNSLDLAALRATIRGHGNPDVDEVEIGSAVRHTLTAADARIVLDTIERRQDTIHAFARRHGLPAHRLYWWRERLVGGIEADPGAVEHLSFAPVVVTGIGQTPAVLVRFGGKRSVKAGSGRPELRHRPARTGPIVDSDRSALR